MQEVICARRHLVSEAFIRSASIFIGLLFDENDEGNLNDDNWFLHSHEMNNWLQVVLKPFKSSNVKASNVLMRLYRQNALLTYIHTW